MRAELLLLLKCCSIRHKFDGEIPPEKANRLWDRAVFLTGNLATAGRYDYLAPDFLVSVRILCFVQSNFDSSCAADENKLGEI